MLDKIRKARGPILKAGAAIGSIAALGGFLNVPLISRQAPPVALHGHENVTSLLGYSIGARARYTVLNEPRTGKGRETEEVRYGEEGEWSERNSVVDYMVGRYGDAALMLVGGLTAAGCGVAASRARKEDGEDGESGEEEAGAGAEQAE
jgi:hypothetical protein